ncbi:MAG TPA: hypothetical protein IAC94_07995 [Candidatus Coprenecus avistercoris]|uniref:Uncharacterized protein n=1 Tax=Candidatus Coprenecus avistercoris TaxID=2840730 RepID=A0A9D1J7R6_9BACT|nr:hypothetical protein [Candidatus Coprenecus avistercoris]
MTVEPDTLRLKIDRLFRLLISEVTERGTGALSGEELDAVARGCSAYLALYPVDDAAWKTADGIWSECRRRMDAAGDSCGAGLLGILRTMYAMDYSAAPVRPRDADGVFGEWRPTLPPASAVASPEGLSALVRILARRLDDPATLAEACAALERQLSLSPDISAAASLLEGLGALLMLTEEGVVLNCA